MSSYIILYKYGRRARDSLGDVVIVNYFCLVFYILVSWGIVHKTIIPLALTGYEMIIVNYSHFAPLWLSTI